MSSSSSPAPPTPARRAARRGAAAAIALLGLLYALAAQRMEAPRVRPFTPDSAYYLSCARNLAEGRGLVVNFTHRVGDPLPAPALYPPPGYAVAMVPLILAGLEPESAALALAQASHLLTVGLFALLGTRRGGVLGCLVATLLGATFWPSVHVAVHAITETLFLFLLVLSLLSVQAALGACREGRVRTGLFVLFGLAAGLAVAVRVAGGVSALLFPLVLALAWRAARPHGKGRAAVTAVALSALAFAAAAGPLVARNLAATGTVGGGRLPPSRVSLGENCDYALTSASTDLLPLASLRLVFCRWGFFPQASVVPAVVLLGIAVALAGRRVARDRALWDLFPLLWGVGYLVVMIVLRSRVWFALLGTRMLLPFYVTLLYFLAEEAARGVGRERASSPRIAAGLVVLCALIVGGQMESFGRVVRVVDRRAPPAAPGAEAAAWLRAHTEEGEVVLAHRPYWLSRRLPSRRFLSAMWLDEPPGPREGDLWRLRERRGARTLVLFKPQAVHRYVGAHELAASPALVHGLACPEAAQEAWDAAHGPPPERLTECGAYIEELFAHLGSREAVLAQELEDALIFRITEPTGAHP